MRPFRRSAVLLTLLFGAGCSDPQAPLTPYTRADVVMGTSLEVTVYRPRSAADAAVEDLEAAFAVITHIDNTMSLYKEDSALVALNADAGAEPVPVSDALFDILSASHFYAELSNAAFDITLQPLVALWGFYDVRKAAVPSQGQIDTVLEWVGPSHMTLDDATRAVSLDAGTALDLGGIAKGYAIDLALAALNDRDVPAALINLGGNVGVLGSAPGGRPWVVGLKHPRGDHLIGQIEFTEGAVSTSGDYDRYFETDGRRYSHVLDPRTGWPVEGFHAVTVHAPTATTADALSTAAFVLGPDEGIALLEGCRDVTAVTAGPAGETNDAQLSVYVTDTVKEKSTRVVMNPAFETGDARIQKDRDARHCVYAPNGDVCMRRMAMRTCEN